MAKIIQCDGCKASMPLGGRGMKWKYHESSFALMRDILRIIPKEDPNGEDYEEEEI